MLQDLNMWFGCSSDGGLLRLLYFAFATPLLFFRFVHLLLLGLRLRVVSGGFTIFARNTGGYILSLGPAGPIARSYLSWGNKVGGNVTAERPSDQIDCPDDGGRRKTRRGDLISKFDRKVSPSPFPRSWLFCS